MPELLHTCGAKLRFPATMEGRRGKCPTCGQIVEIPRSSRPSSGELPALGTLEAPESSPATPALDPVVENARRGLAPVPGDFAAAKAVTKVLRPDEKNELDPPPRWEEYQAYLDGTGPAPRVAIIPVQLMLKDEAEKKWEIAAAKAPPSKYFCPGCKKRLEVGGLICTNCGLDLRTGRSVDKKSKLTPSGMDYLAKIPWLAEAEPPKEQKKLISRKPKDD